MTVTLALCPNRRKHRLLEALDCPESHFICDLYRQVPADRFSTWYSTDDLDYGSKGWHMVLALEPHDLVRLSQKSTKQFAATWLGQEFAAFLRRGDFLSSEEPDSVDDDDESITEQGSAPE